MSVSRFAYADFARKAKQSPADPFMPFVTEAKTVYVYALTRDLCSGCEEQKPLYEGLASSFHGKHGNKVRFAAIHVAQGRRFREELSTFRQMLRFAAYPTYIVLLKADSGTFETYRAIEPPMEELARNITLAVELANR